MVMNDARFSGFKKQQHMELIFEVLLFVLAFLFGIWASVGVVGIVRFVRFMIKTRHEVELPDYFNRERFLCFYQESKIIDGDLFFSTGIAIGNEAD